MFVKEEKNVVYLCMLFRDLLNGSWEIKIIHIYREVNRCADMLANMGSEGTSGIEFFVNPPARARQIVRDDVRGVYVPLSIPKKKTKIF
jgi:hypothetical protein